MPKGRRLFPADIQFMQPSEKNKPRAIGSPRAARWAVRAAMFVRVWFRGFCAPIFNSSSLFSFLTIPFFIFFISVFAGKKGMTDEARVIFSAALAAISALPVWALINLILAPFRTAAEERKLGSWHGNRFVYHTPRSVLTTEWSPANNGTYREFLVPDIPEGAVIDYKIEITGPPTKINCVVFGAYYMRPVEQVLKEMRFASHGRVVLQKKRRLQLLCHSDPSSIPTIVNVAILAWEMDPTLSLEYTDHNTQARFVVRPPEHEQETKTQRGNETV